MSPSALADTLRHAAVVAELLYSSHSAECERIETLERELAARPTEWAYARACKVLEHWRAEAARLGALAGVEPELPPKYYGE